MPHLVRLLYLTLIFTTAILHVAHADVDSSVEAEIEQPKFDIWEFRIAGNTVLSNKQIESAVYGYLGPSKTFDDVQEVREALGNVYRDEGYAFASISIPEQDVDNGVVNLKVVEGKLGRVRVTGNKYYSRKEILENAPSMTEGAIPVIDDIQKDLALLNRSASDRTITPLVRPGKKPDTVDIELKVKDALPFHYGIDYSNRNSPETTDTRFGANFSYSNLWQKNHALSFFYQTTPEDRDEVEVQSIFYSMPLWWENSNLAMYLINSDSDVATVGEINVLGEGRIKGLKASFPFYQTENLFHQVSVGIESKDFDQSALLSATDTQDTPIDYTAINADYGGRIQYDNSNLFYGVGVRAGLRGFGNSPGEFERKRSGAKNNFSYFVGNLGYNYEFANEYQARSRLQFQVSGDPLIGNEQFSAGGQFSVRGYLTSQELGDEGYVANFEVVSPDWSEVFDDNFVSSLRVIGFLDYAKLHNRGVLPGERANISIAGTGLGVRLGLFDHYFLDVDLARALSNSSDGPDAVKDGDWRGHFGISAQY